MREILKKVEIYKNGNGDTRTADHIPDFTEFTTANSLHVTDVIVTADAFCDLLMKSVQRHDWTKTTEPYRSMFYRDMVATMEGRLKFEDGEWAHLHYDELERHHLKRHVPEDVDFVDVLEMIFDCVCAGKARSGEVYPFELHDDVLQKAFQNTVELVKNMIEPRDPPEGK